MMAPSPPHAGEKRERRPVSSQAPPQLLQRKPYLTGSPPSRRERRYRQVCRVIRIIALESGKCQREALCKPCVWALESPLPVIGSGEFYFEDAALKGRRYERST